MCLLVACSEIETVFIPWLMDHVQESATQQLTARTLLDGEEGRATGEGEGEGELLGAVYTYVCNMDT